MTEDEARIWVRSNFGEDALCRLDRLAAETVAANERQNLISPSTVATIWTRHIVDSLQLVHHAPAGLWIDIGSGAGFPGLVVATAQPDRKMFLVEPRRLRAEHLAYCANVLELGNVDVFHARMESVRKVGDVISARAVAPLTALFDMAWGNASLSTVWLLPKGRSAAEELAAVRENWHGVFHVEQSITSPDAHIIVAQGVRAR